MNFWQIRILYIGILVVMALSLAACTAGAVPVPTGTIEQAEETPSQAVSETPSELQKVELAVGYIPDVQFAPLYVAQQKGFYAEEGLEVEIKHGLKENDMVALTAQGELEFAIASGDQVILARAQGIPITYVMKWYQRYPVAVMALAESGISTPEDLMGQTVGLPGFYGANFIGWKALVYATGLDENQITLQEIGFTQAAAVQQGLVEAAMVYIANEPNQLLSQGIEINIIEVSDYIDLVSNGLIVGDKLKAEDPDMVQRMTRATLRGITDVIAHPDEAFAIVRQVIPEMTDDAAPTQRRVLASSIELWQSDRPGFSEPQAWQASADFMEQTDLLEKEIEPETLYTNRFIVED